MSKKIKLSKKRRIDMATQIAPTPMVVGKQAKKIFNATKKPSSEKAIAGAARLIEKFDRLLNK